MGHRVVTGQNHLKRAAVVRVGLPHVGNGETDLETALGGLADRPLHGASGEIRGGDTVTQRGQSQRLSPDTARRVEHRGTRLDPVFTDHSVQLLRLTLDAPIPVRVDQMVLRCYIIVEGQRGQRVQPGWQIMTTGRRIGTVSKREGDELLVVWADRMTSFKAFEYWRTLAVARRLGLENEIQRQVDRGIKNIIAETEDGPCKVGYSKHPDKRLTACQTGNPRRLSLYAVSVSFYHEEDVRAAEYKAHSLLVELYMQGEWFNISSSNCLKLLREWFDGDESTD